MDIVERLRKERELPGRPITKSRLCCEAADEIERLRAALEELVWIDKHTRERVRQVKGIKNVEDHRIMIVRKALKPHQE